MPAAIPENDLQKYLKVKALSDRGATPSERSTASAILLRMEQTHPGIRNAAAVYAKKIIDAEEKKRADTVQPGARAGTSGPVQWSPAGRSSNGPGNFENIFQYAKMFFEQVNEFANAVTDAQLGSHIGNRVRLTPGTSTMGDVTLTVSVDANTFYAVRALTDVQYEAYKARVLSRLAAQLDAMAKK